MKTENLIIFGKTDVIVASGEFSQRRDNVTEPNKVLSTKCVIIKTDIKLLR